MPEKFDKFGFPREEGESMGDSPADRLRAVESYEKIKRLKDATFDPKAFKEPEFEKTLEEIGERYEKRKDNKNEVRRNPEAESREEVVLTTQFTTVFKRNGGIEYRSSSRNRKIAVLSPFSEGPEEGRTYRARVIEDTEPNDPLSGKLIVEIIPDGPSPDPDTFDDYSFARPRPEHLKAQIQRAKRLRESVPFQVLARVVRGTPEIFREMKDVLARREEFKRNTAERGEHHRDFTALFAALHLNKRAARMLDEAIDRTVRTESDWLKEQLAGGNNYVHELIVGAGTHSSVYRQERMIYFPDDAGLVVERQPVIGGQFAESGGAVFSANSRTRPENLDLPNLPGTAGSLNPQGRHAVLNVSDVSGKAYSDNWELARPVRVNQFLMGRIAVNMEITGVYKCPEKYKEGVLFVELRDTETGAPYSVRCDRLLMPTGLEDEKSGLDEKDPQTRQIIEEEKAKFEEGTDAVFMTASQLEKRMADASNPFPLRGMRRVVTWGRGDSWKAAVGGMLGYEHQVGKTVAQLDRVEEVIAIGQEFLTKEEFLRCERARYAQLGLEFPREEVAGYYHRVRPYKGRALRLERRGERDGIAVVAELEDARGSKFIQTFTGDHAISAAGFLAESDKVFRPLYNGVFKDPKEMRDNRFKIFTSPGTEITYRKGGLLSFGVTKRAEIVGVDLESSPKTATIRTYASRRDPVEEVAPLNEETYSRLLDGAESVALGMPVLEKVPGDNLEPIATKFPDLPIYRFGPVSKLPVTEIEKRIAPVLGKIPENSVAMFRYAEKATALARKLAREDERNDVAPQGLSLTAPEEELVTLPKAKGSSLTPSFVQSVPKEIAEKRMDAGSVTPDLLKFVIGERCYNYVFPNDLDSITFHVRRKPASREAAECEFDIETTPRLPLAYGFLIQAIFGDPTMQRMASLLTQRSANTTEKVDIELPLVKIADGSGRVVDIGRIDYEMPRETQVMPRRTARKRGSSK